jgi:hypothetical protein
VDIQRAVLVAGARKKIVVRKGVGVGGGGGWQVQWAEEVVPK